MTPHELGLMTKQAITTKLIQRVATAANRAGKFSGVVGEARRGKFANRLAGWLKNTAKKNYSDIKSKSNVASLPRQGLIPSWVPTSYKLQPDMMSNLHKVFAQGNPSLKPPTVKIRKAFRGLRGDYKLDPHAVRSGTQSSVLLHEMGHAYTMPAMVSRMQKLRSGAFGLSLPGSRANLVAEALANRRAAQSVAEMGRQAGSARPKWLPSVKQYKDFARPQYERYRRGALSGALDKSMYASEIPAWVKRMGVLPPDHMSNLMDNVRRANWRRLAAETA